MKLKVKIIAIIISLSTVLGANSLAPNQDIKTYLQYYNDGIYDAIKQINKEASEGLEEYPLQNQLKGHIVVGIEIGDMSITDIVRISSVAIKNNYTNSVTAKNIITGKDYIIFDSFDREADANYAINRLSGYNVKATKIYNGNWIKNPIVVKRFINDLKKGILANMPVKVIKVVRTIYKTNKNVPLISIKQNDSNISKNIPKQQKITKGKNKNPAAQDNRLLKLFGVMGRLRSKAKFLYQKKSFIYKGKEYKQGDMIEGYKITKISIRNNKKGNKIFVILFDHYYNKHLIIRKKKHSTNNNPVPKKHDADGTIKNKYYKCDFNSIRALYSIKKHKLVRIEKSPYNYLFKTKTSVMYVSKDNKYTYFKQGGLDPMGIKNIAWDNICKKQK